MVKCEAGGGLGQEAIPVAMRTAKLNRKNIRKYSNYYMNRDNI